MKLVTVQELRDLEQRADAGGHPYAAMMENAGRAVAEAIEMRLPVKGGRVLVLVGPGNNGGDGLVAARYLAQAGAQIICYLWRERPADDANLAAARRLSVHCFSSAAGENGKMLSKALQNVDIIIDALLGTGIARPIEGDLARLLHTVRAAVQERRSAAATGLVELVPPTPPPGLGAVPQPYVVAVDVPSGLNCDTGELDPAALRADLTVTFAAAKHGQLRFPGASALGELVIADIGIDPDLAAGLPIEVATAPAIRAALPDRPDDAHKGTFGKAMVVAGSVNYTGAPYLAAAAAARVGVGLVTLAPPQAIHASLAARLNEATYILLPHEMGALVPDAARILAERLEGYSALLLGPGLGRDPKTVAFVHQLLGLVHAVRRRGMGFQPGTQAAESQGAGLPPLVVDADALNALAEAEEWWTTLPRRSILTPHPGEMARLTGLSTGEVNADRIGVARDRAQAWEQVVVLKGAFSVIAAPDGRATILPFANAGLATAGTGDVLAGAIAGMLAQGLEPFAAALCGAYVHALAGQIVAQRVGPAGMLAGDLLPALPEALKRLRA
ncbi:MAG: NAD(P)H-hydrate dehydratase [Anaerolineae bacterium]|nr:NAD(P)H-hydrate dehydratase [Anaerolineae bacterium]